MRYINFSSNNNNNNNRLHSSRLQKWYRSVHRKAERVSPKSDCWDVKGPAVRESSTILKEYFSLSTCLSLDSHIMIDWYSWELNIKLVCSQKGCYESSEMYRCIRIWWCWRRRYIGLNCVFLNQVITEDVLCIVAYAMFVYVLHV